MSHVPPNSPAYGSPQGRAASPVSITEAFDFDKLMENLVLHSCKPGSLRRVEGAVRMLAAAGALHRAKEYKGRPGFLPPMHTCAAVTRYDPDKIGAAIHNPQWVEIIDYLATQRFDPNVITWTGDTALTLAAYTCPAFRIVPTCRALIAAGASPLLTGWLDLSPLEHLEFRIKVTEAKGFDFGDLTGPAQKKLHMASGDAELTGLMKSKMRNAVQELPTAEKIAKLKEAKSLLDNAELEAFTY